jgi:hypothetical protein
MDLRLAYQATSNDPDPPAIAMGLDDVEIDFCGSDSFLKPFAFL